MLYLFESAETRVFPTVELLAEASPLWWTEGGHRPVDVAAISFLDGGRDIGAQIYGSTAECFRVLHIIPDLAADAGLAAWDLEDAEALAPAWQIITNSCRAERTALPSLLGLAAPSLPARLRAEWQNS